MDPGDSCPEEILKRVMGMTELDVPFDDLMSDVSFWSSGSPLHSGAPVFRRLCHKASGSELSGHPGNVSVDVMIVSFTHC